MTKYETVSPIQLFAITFTVFSGYCEKWWRTSADPPLDARLWHADGHQVRDQGL